MAFAGVLTSLAHPLSTDGRGAERTPEAPTPFTPFRHLQGEMRWAALEADRRVLGRRLILTDRLRQS